MGTETYIKREDRASAPWHGESNERDAAKVEEQSETEVVVGRVVRRADSER